MTEQRFADRSDRAGKSGKGVINVASGIEKMFSTSKEIGALNIGVKLKDR